jgi:hypothetical protein
MTYDHLERGHRRTDTQSSRAPLISFGGDHGEPDTHGQCVVVEDHFALERGRIPGDTHATSAPLISFDGDQGGRDAHRRVVAVEDTLAGHVAVGDHHDLERGHERSDTHGGGAPLSDGRGQFGRDAHCAGAPAVNHLERGQGDCDAHTTRAPLNTLFGGDHSIRDTHAWRVAVEGHLDDLERGHRLPGTQTKRAPLISFGGDQTSSDTHRAPVTVEDTFERGQRCCDTQARCAPLITSFGGDQRRVDTQTGSVAVEDTQEGVT